MTYYRNFQVVANEYAATKPVNEREHDRNDRTRKEFGTSRDLRPIANRYRKWERIAKISDTCYALLCGHTYGDMVYMSWRYKTLTAQAGHCGVLCTDRVASHRGQRCYQCEQRAL
jgi:hypothetical protein